MLFAALLRDPSKSFVFKVTIPTVSVILCEPLALQNLAMNKSYPTDYILDNVHGFQIIVHMARV